MKKADMITHLRNESLLKRAFELEMIGIVIQDGMYSYLKINDAYIHELYELLGNEITRTAQKPDYFSLDKAIGAHITIIYPEENKLIHPDEIGKLHRFSVQSFCRAIVGIKEYYVLLVSSSSLAALRKKHDLPEKLCFKGISIDFHITLATAYIME